VESPDENDIHALLLLIYRYSSYCN